MLLGSRRHDTRLLVVTDALLEEVRLACKRDVLHEIEGVGGLVVLLVTEREQQAVSDELDVLLHQVGVHAEQRARKSLGQELLLDFDGFSDDILDSLLAWAVLEVGEEKAGKVGVQTLVTGDELVGEGKTGHETALLEPEDGGKGAREEDTLNGGKGHQALSEGRVFVLNPPDGPVGLLLDTWDGLDGVEEVGFLGLLLDVCIDEEGVCLGVDVLNHDLETVEATCFWDLNFATETLEQVLVDNSVGGGEESEDMGDEVALVIIENVVPVV